MITSLLNLLSIIILGSIVLRLGRVERAMIIRAARWLMIAGLAPLGFLFVLYMCFGISEMASGEAGGAMHVVQAVVIALMGVLAWLRPFEAGIVFLASGGLFGIGFTLAFIKTLTIPAAGMISPSVMLLSLPQMISGTLFLVAGLLARKGKNPGTF